VLGYPVVPNVAMANTRPRDYAALVLPGGNVTKLMENAALRAFLREAAAGRVRIATASQAAALAPDSLTAANTDDIPRWTRALIEELSR